MIEILTKEGISLDLKSDLDIEFTIEQALLDSDNMPVGISTTIAFPLSTKNRIVFGYWNGAFIGAKNCSIPAQMLVNGVALLDGELTFICVTENEIEYSFRGAELPAFVEGQMHELPDLELMTSGWLLDESRRKGREDIAFPMMVRQTYVANCEQQIGTGTYWLNDTNSSISNRECFAFDKYVNHGLVFSQTGNIAVVKVLWLIKKIFPNISIDDDMMEILSKLVIIAPNDVTVYKQTDLCEGPYDEGGRNVLNLSKALPKISCVDFLSNILKMFAASIYATGQKFQIKTAKSILNSANYVDWSKKACELTSVSTREPQIYELSYANSPDSSKEEAKVSGNTEEEEEITSCATIEDMFAYFNSHSELVNAKVEGNPDLFAGKKMDVSLLYENVYSGVNIGWKWVAPLVTQPILDNANQLGAKSITVDSSNTDTFNYKIEFNCVRCIPSHVYLSSEKSTGHGTGLKAICPVLEFPNIEGDRSTETYIGLLVNNQLIAYGNVYTGQSWGAGYAATSAGTETQNDLSIAILGDNGLYTKYHKQFADWITAKKHIFKMNVSLDISDIANLDLSRKVMIHNQPFLIKSITIKVNTSSGIGLSEVELIEI